MAETVFDRETLLDTVVNVVPLAIMLFFILLFVAAGTWGGTSGLVGMISLGLLVIPFAGLALLTYLTARKI